MTKDRRLGKGLAALLGTPLDEMQPVAGGVANATTESQMPPPNHRESRINTVAPSLQAAAHVATPNHSTVELAVDEIENNPFQPRRQFNEEEIASLAESLKEHQQLQPVLVRKVAGKYQLISGERRLRAAIRAGFKTVRAEVRDADDRLVAELAIVENLQRKDLNPIEKAMSFRRYLDEHRCSQEELARRLKIDRSTIANLMRLLELPDAILDDVQTDRVSAGHARALLPLGDESLQMRFCKQIKEEGWSVRETERRVSEFLDSENADDVLDRAAPTVSRKKTVSPQIASLEQEIRSALGTKVEIKQNSNGRGRIVVQFGSEEEFERIRELLLSTASGPRLARVA
ncbi:MAG: ParB/RepB/Spo0J family partition protein [Planctomycetaceae bacterium]|nr:ParB/RepB/Spo0J family partition protein [Planctomycetaceae bacterium]